MSHWKECGHEVSGAESECLYCRIEELQAQIKSGVVITERQTGLVTKNLELEAQLAEQEGLLHECDNNIAKKADKIRELEGIIERVRPLSKRWRGGVEFASGLRIERITSIDQEQCADELDKALEDQK